jgi:glutaredoxin
MLLFFVSFLQSSLQSAVSLPWGLGDLINLTLSYLGSFSRFYNGSIAANNLISCQRPKKPLIFYQYEGCPYCRKVREIMSVLALDVVVYPCPRTTLAKYGVTESSRFRSVATKLSGQCMFPILIDENISPRLVMLESSEIVSYLWKTYGAQATAPWNSKLANLSIFQYFLVLPTLFRPLPEMGFMRIPSNSPPPQMIELYGYDACPHTRLVRELLDSLEIPYLYHNTPLLQNSAGVEKMQERFSTLCGGRGRSATPLFVDQHQKFVSTSSLEVIGHLQRVYQKEKSGQAKWSEYTTEGASEQHGVIPGFKKD